MSTVSNVLSFIWRTQGSSSLYRNI